MDVGKYLAKIVLNDVEITLDCLTKLQNLHQLHIPWENLDVFTNRRKRLVVEEMYEQIVVQHRGGWCHELNGLFAWLLRSLGFEVKMVSANYCLPETGEFEGDFGHLALIVRLAGEDYLAEVGLGSVNQPFSPLLLVEGESESDQPGGEYRLVRTEAHWVLQHQERNIEGHHQHHKNRLNTHPSWKSLFRFEETARELSEFQAMCDQHQTNKEIILANAPLAFIMADQGRVVNTLTGRRFTSVRFLGGAEVRTNQLSLTNQEYNQTLRNTFGIELPQPLDIENIYIKEMFQQ